jgi:signal transduction histidine kinase
LVCKDFGIGIPEADLPQLGTSFERAGNVGDIEGTGLGLVVVRYFIEKHGGSLHFESAESIGTVVTLTFPY